MNKIWLIIKREYITRVRTKSFLISTLIVPLAIVGLMAASIWIAINSNEKVTIAVKDDSHLFEDKFRGLDQGETLVFKYKKNSDLDELKQQVKNEEIGGVLYIPDIDIDHPKGIKYYANNQLGPTTESVISNALTDVVKSEVLKREGYDIALLKKLDETVGFESIINEKEKSGMSDISSAIGYIMGFVMYMFIFIYGAMVMRAVAEEKTNRIVEVMLSSIKPFQLLTGKVIGIGLVALTQSILWFGAIICAQFILGLVFAGQIQQVADMQTMNVGSNPSEAAVLEAIEALKTLDLSRIWISFFFYFIFGFLFYGAQFAAVGAAVTDDTDANSYTLPISMPIIISIIIMSVAVQQPGASVAVWGSMIPWFSPVVMPARIPFDVSMAEQIISMLILIVSAVAMIWLAARIYRVGILIQGKKVSFKDLGKWIFSKY
ncbi:MAG: ABC transporter permease [Chitinophagales bacterium]|nr:ABC transporter permease [Chitinophagales bacterium]